MFLKRNTKQNLEVSTIDQLMLFGLTRQEATIYCCLLQDGEQNGYEVAKQTGISRSNVYNALAGLVEKGAAYLIEGNSVKYVAVPVAEFCDNKIRKCQEVKEELVQLLVPNKPTTEGYITITGVSHIRDKLLQMMQQAEKRIYMSIPSIYLEDWREELEQLGKNKIKVVVLTEQLVKMQNVKVYLSEKRDKQLRFIVDSKFVLTGDYSKSEKDTCLYSGQKNFVNVFKEALRNEIKLIELKKQDNN